MKEPQATSPMPVHQREQQRNFLITDVTSINRRCKIELEHRMVEMVDECSAVFHSGIWIAQHGE